MKKYQQVVFLVFVLAVCILCALLPMFAFDPSEKVLFGLTVEELQGYVYFGSTFVITGFVIQYIYRLYTSEKKDGVDYEKYSNIMLDDGDITKPFEKLEK
jgi:cbb3-type cytochrome c oxidase CcoQ subunit